MASRLFRKHRKRGFPRNSRGKFILRQIFIENMRETAPPKPRARVALRTRLSALAGRGEENGSLCCHGPHPRWELQGVCSGWAGQSQEQCT